MDFMTHIDIKPLPRLITYQDSLLLVGSCFTEHIGNSLENLKYSVLQNPNGILFDPMSVSQSLVTYTEKKMISEKDIFQLDDVWHSWQYHSRFSNTNPHDAVEKMNQSTQQAHTFLQKANWVIITLGSAFSYRLKDKGAAGSVANCHRAPAQWFDKYLMETEEIVQALHASYQKLVAFNPGLHFIFTISPVRHLRDGVVENNRSKSRLIEAVHSLVNRHENIYYFPAYELVIDVLRDYRFYDIDLAHPNYAATAFVMQHFTTSCIDGESRQIMEDVNSIVTARKHRAFQPETTAHRQFLSAYLEKTKLLSKKYPFLDLKKELEYFEKE